METQAKNAWNKFAGLFDFKYWITAAILAIILAAGIYSFLTQPAFPSEQEMYSFIVHNFNGTLNRNIILPTSFITIYNSTLKSNNATIKFNPDNKTYIYYFGLDDCAECAIESYVLWNYTTQKPFPSLDLDNFYLAAYNIPGIENSDIKLNSTNYLLSMTEVPLTVEKASSKAYNQSELYIVKWMIGNLSETQKFLFSVAGTGYFPSVFVVKTDGNKTIVCNAFSNANLVLYNATTTNQFLGYDMQGVTFGSELPTKQSVNENLNYLNTCVNYVDRWKS